MEVNIHKLKYLLIPLLLLPLLFLIDWNKEDIADREEQIEEKDYFDVLSEAGIDSRDSRRLADIKNIQGGLDLFFLDNEYYPETLEPLVEGGYLPNIPKDPTPEERAYVYTPIGSSPAQYYDLSFKLEVGTDDYPEGLNIVNP
ncbi:MAG: hypothetical protein ABH835_02320 [Patescibacteria group bacterium]|nr:type II secretion system protein GspG [Patescibacteria group bacterium]